MAKDNTKQASTERELLRQAAACLDDAVELVQELLDQHDVRFGRRNGQNRRRAEALEADIMTFRCTARACRTAAQVERDVVKALRRRRLERNVDARLDRMRGRGTQEQEQEANTND